MFEESPAGCDCVTGWCRDSCSHLELSGGLQYLNCRLVASSSNQPVLECNHNCSCQPGRCDNRLVQAGPSPDLAVLQVEGKGWGVLTTRDLLQGQFVCEYAGEVIGEEEARARWSRQLQLSLSNYIMVVREYSGTNLVSKTIVDPTGKIENSVLVLLSTCSIMLQ